MPTHAEQRVLAYTPEQLFALVADIERYPEFLPWCLAARIKERRADLIVADLIIGFRIFRERFTSRVALDGPRRIDVTYAEGPFRRLNNHWVFEQAPGGCRIDFYVDFEFKSRVMLRHTGAQRRRPGSRVRPGPGPEAVAEEPGKGGLVAAG